jgi:hypothetical protein
MVIAPSLAHANTPPKLDDQTCKDMRGEKQKFLDSGLLANVEKGPEWAKANMSPDQLRQVELFLLLDEQLKFACRDARISLEAQQAGDAAKALEANPDADPNAPPKPKRDPSKASVVPPPLAPTVKDKLAKEKAAAKLKASKSKPKPVNDALVIDPNTPKAKPKPVTVTVEPDPAATAREKSKPSDLPWTAEPKPAP